LEIQGSVSEGPAGLYTFSTPDAEFLIDGILEIRILYKSPFDGAGRAELVLRPRIPGFGAGLEITAAEIAVSAHGIGVRALDGGMRKDAVGCTPLTLDAQARIQLPDHFLLGRPAEKPDRQSSQDKAGR
jgi:hypothetical protein